MLGIFPGGGGTQRLMRQMSPCQAKLMMFTGDNLSADDALLYEATAIALAFDTADAHEGMSAFLDKHPPNFTGH